MLPCRSPLLALAAAVSAVAPVPAQDPIQRPRGPEIVAAGDGLRTVPADRASIMVSVETHGQTPSITGRRNAAQNNAIRDAIAAVGIPRSDIATSGYTSYMLRREPGIFGRDTGFVSHNTIRITLRTPEQLALLGRVIDTALSAGATHIMGVHYEARRTDEAEREALAVAVADARARAEAMARAAGGSLGDLLELSSAPAYGGPPYPMPMAGGMRAASLRLEPATTITAGEIEVRQQVAARWRFVPASR
jgi:uncharacterized protein YggE